MQLNGLPNSQTVEMNLTLPMQFGSEFCPNIAKNLVALTNLSTAETGAFRQLELYGHDHPEEGF